MTDEVLRLLELYVTLLPLSTAHDADYLTSQMDQLLHRLVLHLRADMFVCSLLFTSQYLLHSSSLLALRPASILQSARELSRSSLPSLRFKQGPSHLRYRPSPLLRYAAHLLRPPRR